MPLPVVLSYIQAEELLRAHREGQSSVQVSPDLGLSTVTVQLTHDGVRFPGGESLSWAGIEHIGEARNVAFALEGDEAHEIRRFADTTGWVRALMPTSGAPTMLVAGLPMHRIKETDPYADTLKKVKTIAPIVGRVLDTATGLGYTAIEAAKTAEEVVTIELDPGAQEIARLNPWSQALFDNPKIEQIIGDAYEVVQAFEDESFARIIHDPPTFSLAGDLYSDAFYRQLY